MSAVKNHWNFSSYPITSKSNLSDFFGETKKHYIWEQKLVSPEEQMIQFIIKESSTAVQHHGYQKFPYLEIPPNPFFSELKFEKCKIRVPKLF